MINVNGSRTMNNDEVRTKHLYMHYSDVTLFVDITNEWDLVNIVATLKLMYKTFPYYSTGCFFIGVK